MLEIRGVFSQHDIVLPCIKGFSVLLSYSIYPDQAILSTDFCANQSRAVA